MTDPAPRLSRTVRIPNRRGLHARAAAKLVTLAEAYPAEIEVARDGQAVSARSIMGLMMLGAGCGATVELRAQDQDGEAAMAAIAALIEAGFHESD